MSFWDQLFNPSKSGNQSVQKGIDTLTAAGTDAVGLLQPYADQGSKAYNQISNLNGLNGSQAQTDAMSRFTTDPGYQFKLQQGVDAIDRSAFARGSGASGQTLKALTEYGQGVADQGYGDYYSRLAGMGNTGVNAAGVQASTKVNTANGQAQGYSSIGANQTNSNINTGNLVTGGLKTLLGSMF